MAAPLRSDYGYHGGPPPGQGHYPSYPDSGSTYEDDRSRAPPPRRSPPRRSEQPYFEPPPRDAYTPTKDGRPGPYDRSPPPGEQFAEYSAPPSDRPYSDRDFPTEGHARRSSRPYAPSNPGPHEFNQVAPYDDEKAEAEWNRGVNDAYTYQRPPPPPQTEYSRRRGDIDDRSTMYDDRSTMYDERERERDRDRDRRYDDRYYEDREYDRERERRKRRDEEMMKEKALRYPSDPKKGGRDIFGASEGERGLGAKLLGGAGGAWLAHEKTHSTLETIGGALVGAIAAGVVEKQYEKRSAEKALKHSRRNEDPRDIGFPQPGRDMEDVRRTGRDGIAYVDDESVPPPRTRSRTRSRTGFRDRLRRSLSRAGSERRRRRSSSEDSEETRRR